MTTAPLSSAVRVRTRPLDEGAAPLLDQLPDQSPLSWVRGGDGLVGWGVLTRWTGSGPDRFAEADAWWRSMSAQLDVFDEVGLPGTGPVAFGSFTFRDDAPGSVLVVPRVVVGRRGGRAWITEFTTDGRAEPLRSVRPVRPSGPLRWSDGNLSVDGYRAAVAEAVRRMRAGRLEKAVFAHDLLALSDAPLDPRHLLGGLARRYPTCWAFAVEGLVGATPELLVRRAGDVVESRVLAGTTWAANASDEGLEQRLLDSVKDRHEHALAVDSLAGSLAPLCTELDVPSAPSVLALRNVSHLATDVRGRLRDDGDGPAGLLRLAAAVHPTAAVGGTPRAAALDVIAELETMDRGRYAGPVGWVDARGDGELGIALRCAQLDGPTARLYAGCGVVAGSDPDSEAAEAAAKLRAVRDALEDEG